MNDSFLIPPESRFHGTDPWHSPAWLKRLTYPPEADLTMRCIILNIKQEILFSKYFGTTTCLYSLLKVIF